jgi:hypothetical protein
MQHTLELIPETAVNVTFFTSMFFEELEDEEGNKTVKLNEEARCYTKIHFDYNLRKDQVVKLLFRSENLTHYYDVKVHAGPCFSESYSVPIAMNYTFKYDPQQRWGTVINDSLPLDYEDHFYISVAPKKGAINVQYLNNLLNTKA